MDAEFIHLHVHSQYSLLEGAMKIPYLIDACVKNNMPAIAITDTENLFGGMDFSYACANAGVQPILGTQLLFKKEQEKGQFLTLKEETAFVSHSLTATHKPNSHNHDDAQTSPKTPFCPCRKVARLRLHNILASSDL